MHLFIQNKYVIRSARILFGLIFVMAGMEKIVNPSGFAQSIANYKILPQTFINITAIILPWFELICGILLIFGIWIKENLFILNVLLIIFIVLICISILRGLDINCGCYGNVHYQKIGWIKIIENLLLLYIGWYIYKFYKIKHIISDV